MRKFGFFSSFATSQTRYSWCPKQDIAKCTTDPRDENGLPKYQKIAVFFQENFPKALSYFETRFNMSKPSVSRAGKE